MKLLIMQCSPASRHFLPRGSTLITRHGLFTWEFASSV